MGALASFKIPQHTVLMTEFPMTSSGKVQKFKLREMATEALGLQALPPVHTDGRQLVEQTL